MALIKKLKALSNDSSKDATEYARRIGSEIHPEQVKICNQIETFIRKIKEARDNLEEESVKARVNPTRSNRTTELTDTISLRKLFDLIDEAFKEIVESSKTDHEETSGSSSLWEND